MTKPWLDDKQFMKCLPITLVQEGGYSNDAHDPGGMTMKGIIQREYDKYRKANGLALQWVHSISDDEVHAIYYSSYWLPHCVVLPDGVDLSFFDLCVNAGPMRAIAVLQQAYGIHADGLWGPMTTNAVIAKPVDTVSLIKNYTVARARFYHSLRTFQYFGKGWIRRTTEIETAALAMEKEGLGNGES